MISAFFIFCGAVTLVAAYLTVVHFFLRAGEEIDDDDGAVFSH